MIFQGKSRKGNSTTRYLSTSSRQNFRVKTKTKYKNRQKALCQQKVHLQRDNIACKLFKAIPKCKIRLQTSQDQQRELEILFNYQKVQLIEPIYTGKQSTVYIAKMQGNVSYVAVKKTKTDLSLKNRQEQLLKQLKSPYIVQKLAVYNTFDRQGNRECNIIMKRYSHNLRQVIEDRQQFTSMQLKVYIYQIMRALMNLHSKGICHRDIQPENILVQRNKLVLSDFSSAKKLIPIQENCTEVGRLEYRAPQILAGYPFYTLTSDIWSAGCLIGQMVTKRPIFRGINRIDQLIKISHCLGCPEWRSLSWASNEKMLGKIPCIKAIGFKKLFPQDTCQQLIDLISKMLTWNPKQRLSATEVLCHNFFEELRDQNILIGIENQVRQVPHLLVFQRRELQDNEHLIYKLIPGWARDRFVKSENQT